MLIIQGRAMRMIALLAAAGIGAAPAHAQSRRDGIPAIQGETPKIVSKDEIVGLTTQKDVQVQAGDASAMPTRGLATLVTNAERLAIKFLGYAELAGEYRLNSDDVISIPVLGRIPVANVTVADLERILAERVAIVTGREAYVNVEVIEYKPVFVSGRVNKPGPAPWKPGTTVLHALTLAGGLLKASDSLAADVETTRWERSFSDFKRVQATLARLNAEQQNAATIATPDRLREFIGNDEAAALMGGQLSIMRSRDNTFATQISTLERTADTARQELRGLREQLKRTKDYAVARSERRRGIEELVAKGYARAERSMEEQLKANELDERTTNIVLAILKLETSLASVQRDISNLTQNRRAAIDSEILQLERESAQHEIGMKAARAAYLKLTGLDIGKPASDRPTKTRLEIVRNDAGITKTLSAELFTFLWPGDIVVVGLEREDLGFGQPPSR